MLEVLAQAREFLEQALVLLNEGNLAYALALVAAASVIALVIFGIMRSISRRLQGLFLEWAGTRIPAVTYQKQEILSVADTVGLAAGFAAVLLLMLD